MDLVGKRTFVRRNLHCGCVRLNVMGLLWSCQGIRTQRHGRTIGSDDGDDGDGGVFTTLPLWMLCDLLRPW